MKRGNRAVPSLDDVNIELCGLLTRMQDGDKRGRKEVGAGAEVEHRYSRTVQSVPCTYTVHSSRLWCLRSGANPLSSQVRTMYGSLDQTRTDGDGRNRAKISQNLVSRKSEMSDKCDGFERT